jgi:streptogramin lyase
LGFQGNGIPEEKGITRLIDKSDIPDCPDKIRRDFMWIRIAKTKQNLHFLIIVGSLISLITACSTSKGNDQHLTTATKIEISSSPTLPSPIPTDTPIPATPTPLEATVPAPSEVPIEVGEFQLEIMNEELDFGDIRSLWIDPGGKLWLGTDFGVFVHNDLSWEKIFPGAVESLLGADENGVVWVVLEGDTQIASYDQSGNWQVFGAEQGWTEPEDMEYLSPGYGDGFVTDHQGRVWLATGRDDVRVFDPQGGVWKVLSAVDIGYSPAGAPEYQGHFLSDVELSSTQKVWIADCIGEGETLKGQGIRWTDGESWFSAPDTAAECAQDIEIDGEGKMWVGGFDALLMYDPELGYWTRFPLPSWERHQLVAEIDLDDNGSPWVEVIRSGGAGPLGDVVRYHLEKGEWYKDFEGWFSSLAFGEPGVTWLCSEGTIYKIESRNLEKMAELPGMMCDIKVDGSGRIWVTNFSELWRFDPGDGY